MRGPAWPGIYNRAAYGPEKRAALERWAAHVQGLASGRYRWASFLTANRIPWPCLESGRLDLSDDTFRQMAKAYPIASPVRELRSALSDLRLNDLAVGRDGRNRGILSAFRARSSRNAPSNTKFVFGPSVWLRGLIKPPPGYGVAHIDWSQQEFGIAAALSGDTAMQAAYVTGDPYLAFAKQAGAVPPDATKQSHGAQRELFKQCVLGVAYGMEAESLALRIGQPPIVARDLLRAHRETYRRFWAWSDAAVDTAMLHGSPAFGFWLAPAYRARTPTRDPCAISRCRPMARNVAGRLLLGDRARDRGLRARPRRCADLRPARSTRRGYRGHAGRHGRGFARRSWRLRAQDGRARSALSGSLHGRARARMWDRVCSLVQQAAGVGGREAMSA